jgi:branched-chain amino acid transport system ATP-binding protein
MEDVEVSESVQTALPRDPSDHAERVVPVSSNDSPLLALSGVHVTFNRVVALDGLSLHVNEGEFVALLGPNGAGKSTALRAISGLLRPSKGTVTFGEQRIDRLSAPRIARLGIGLVPEGRKVFPDQTVMENLLLGGYIWRGKRAIRQETLNSVLELFPRLGERSRQLAGTLSGGEAQMLAVARALMLRPRLLMLDEPTLGLAPKVVEEMFTYLARLHSEQGITILLVEQAAARALEVADRSYLIGGGKVVASGVAEEMRAHPEMQRVYFGGSVEQ